MEDGQIRESEESRLRPRKKRRKKKRKKPNHVASFFNSLGDLWSQYEVILKPVSIAFGVAVFVFCTLTFLNSKTGDQEEYLGRTTSKWLELEAQGKARRAEALWRDQRWMSLEMVLGLDWAAVPELFDALNNPKTKSLAETVLGKYSGTIGSPDPNDIIAGLRRDEEIVQLWAARLASKLEEKTDQVMPLLDELAQSKNEQLSGEAKRSRESLSAKSKA